MSTTLRTQLPRWIIVAFLVATSLLTQGTGKAVAQAAGSPAVHEVAWGETLSTIAAEYGVAVETIATANHVDVADILAAGQQLVIPGAVPAESPAAQAQTHVVQPGEGLFRIGLTYGVTVNDLMVANGLANPDAIYVGQVLIIPAPGAAAATPQVATGGPSAAGSYHTVQAGENLYRISLQYGVTVDALTAANGLISAGEIYTGQQLTIPGASGVAAAPPSAAATTPVSGSHVVQAGETLGAISARYGVSMTALVQANNLSNPSLLYAGQTLSIPGAGTIRTETVTAPTPTPSSTGQHTVQAGDTLFRISLQYGVSMANLLAANGLGNGDTIYAGQVLTIPDGSVSAPPAAAAPPPSGGPGATVVDGKQIVVVLSQQMVYAYENGQILRQFVVSTGLPQTPTVQGDYAVYVKYDSTRMTGADYDLPGVPWTMYFYQGYGFHGTYWHNNFGNPMSHGCVNMRTPEAEWLYMWAPVGTPVHIIWS